MRVHSTFPEIAPKGKIALKNRLVIDPWKAIGIISPLCMLATFPGMARADNWALLIGIDQYEDANRINPLGAAGADAKALAKTLKDKVAFADDHIQLLVSDGDSKPTRANILKSLSLLITNANPGDTVFVFYSGHGIEINGTPYMLPFDTSAIDQDTFTATALSLPDFQARLARIKSKALILALDMSRNNPGSRSRGFSPTSHKQSPESEHGFHLAQATYAIAPPDQESTVSINPPGLERKLDFNTNPNTARSTPITATLFACRPNQRSYEWQEKGRGYFSYYLEQGLMGKAADTSGRVTLGGLADYVTRQVQTVVDQKEHRQQTPYAALDGAGAESFVLEEGATLSLIPAVLEEAKRSAENITDATNKSTALRNIALSQYESDDLSGAKATLTLARTTAENITDAAKKSFALSSIAIVQIKIGDIAGAQATLATARTVAQNISDPYQRTEALRQIADGMIAVTKATK